MMAVFVDDQLGGETRLLGKHQNVVDAVHTVLEFYIKHLRQLEISKNSAKSITRKAAIIKPTGKINPKQS